MNSTHTDKNAATSSSYLKKTCTANWLEPRFIGLQISLIAATMPQRQAALFHGTLEPQMRQYSYLSSKTIKKDSAYPAVHITAKQNFFPLHFVYIMKKCAATMGGIGISGYETCTSQGFVL